jgi:uncharacterized protein YeaO (DUF488 family)
MNTFARNQSMKIYTSSWFTSLPSDVIRIGVSRGPPRGQRGYRLMREVAPGAWFRTASEQQYIALYQAQLAKLDPLRVLDRLLELSSGASSVALLCFEKADTGDTWCHRSLLAAWLSEGLGTMVHEWGYGDHAAHPLLPPSLRAPHWITPCPANRACRRS